MAAYKGLHLCVLLLTFSPAEGKEFTVTCLSPEECVLPCQFQSDGKGARIMWYKKKAVVSCTRYGDTSFVIGHNSPAYKYQNRTGLYADQVLKGNATLLLKNVTPNDQGKYFCITMTAPRTDESGVISLVVKAPVREVDMEFSGDLVTCRAEGIFPAPTLTWSTDPPISTELLQDQTTTQKNHHGYYIIQSSLTVMGNNTTNQTYICCVTGDTNKRTAFLKHEASVSTSAGRDVTVPCSLPHSIPQIFNLTWRFNRSDPILSISKSLVKVWDQWKAHVSSNLSAWRGLQLLSLKPEHQGTYTCEVSTPEETYITWTDVTVTEDPKHFTYIIVFVGVISCLSFFLCLTYQKMAVWGFKNLILKALKRAEEEEEERSHEVTVALNPSEANGALTVREEAGDEMRLNKPFV